jgi:hypothetical protein
MATANFPSELTGLDQTQVDELISGQTIKLFVFAIITYMDAFKESRETKLCVSVDATKATSAPSKYAVTFEHADQHNTAT